MLVSNRNEAKNRNLLRLKKMQTTNPVACHSDFFCPGPYPLQDQRCGGWCHPFPRNWSHLEEADDTGLKVSAMMQERKVIFYRRRVFEKI